MSSLARRLNNRRAEATQKLIVFYIHQEWFTLPIQAAEKVVLLDRLYGASEGQGLRFAHYGDREILVIDVKQRIFSCLEPHAAPQLISKPALADLSKDDPASSPTYLLIVQDAQGEQIGIPLESQPFLRRAVLSAFKPLPPAYLAEGKIRCVSALVVLANEPPLFLLNLDQLLHIPSRSLPSSLS